MAPVKFSRVISVSSEDPRYPAKNLLNSSAGSSWKCKDPGEKQAAIILELEESCVIQSIDIGNENSAFVEIFVGKSVMPDCFEILRVASVLMSVKDVRSGQNKNVVRFFKHDEFTKPAANQSWDRLKIICTQPFNKQAQYGLAFVKVHAKSEVSSSEKDDSIFGKFSLKKEDNDNDTISVGSFFAKRKDIGELTAATAIRQASSDLGGSLLNKIPKRLSDVLSNKDTKKQRKNNDISDDHNLDDGRRSTTGQLLYSDEQDDETDENNPKKDKLKDSKAQTPKAEQKAPKPFGKASQTKNPFDSPSSSKAKKNNARPTPTPKPKNDDSPKLKNDTLAKKRPNSDDHSNEQKKLKFDKVVPKKKPFNKLLEGVVFAISGYQNPFRSELRSKALKMGAKYKADWDDGCTHLICAFTNTPKYVQVLGEGWIVRKDWIEDCYNQRKRLSCVRYKLDKNDPYTSPNDEEIWEGEENQTSQTTLVNNQPIISQQSFDDNVSNETNVTGSQPVSSQPDIYDAETDIDSEYEDPMLDKKYENVSLKVLPALFENKKFYLGTDLLQSTVNVLRRYIIAYKGQPHEDVDDVNYIISENFKYKDNVTNTPVLLPDWIWECNDRKKLIPIDDYLL